MSTEGGPADRAGARSVGTSFGEGVSVVLARASPSATETVVDDQLFLYAPRVREVLVLNGSAAAIWASTDRARPVDEVVAEVAATFGLAVAEVVAEVRGTLDRFTAAGLLVEVAPE